MGEPVSLLHAPALAQVGVPHAFTTRHGGVSSGPFASLNFGNPGELPPERKDPAGNIAENLRRVLGWLGCAERRVVEVHQVHGVAVHVVRRGEPDHAGAHDTRADALVTDDPGRLVAVRVADCAPVLMTSVDGRVVAAVHAGWRGVAGGVVPATIETMRREFGVGPESIRAAIGPCIGMEAFQVGPEVASAFEAIARAGGGTAGTAGAIVAADPGAAGRWRVSIRLALERQMMACGVVGGAINAPEWCTHGESRFFSHRREAGLTGRMIGIIGPRGSWRDAGRAGGGC